MKEKHKVMILKFTSSEYKHVVPHPEGSMLIVSIVEFDKCQPASIFCYVAPEPSLDRNCAKAFPSVIYEDYRESAAASNGLPLSGWWTVTELCWTALYYLNTLLLVLYCYLCSAIMAFRSTMGRWKTLMSNGIRGGSKASAYATSTTPKMKAYAPTVDYGYAQQHQQGKSSRPVKGDYVPVYVAIGMIALSTSLGLHTAWQQLRHSPTVRVKKQRRETLPEVVEPEHVVEESEKFLNKSFFRKVAHVQEYYNPEKQVIPDPIRKDAYAHPPRVETLKSVGVDPAQV
ncbi:hypothetical protein L6164_014944 [Bauhinia variegata]|uniref:Uncharacterized protein n=1 Tax=Bauhinia variegata TaxID=167791 RepID=A0ACB9NJ76_BAUVA|nr:hypothetical protein L6164_014944 [Bauhinia variegata]